MSMKHTRNDALGDSHDIKIIDPHVEETRRPERDDGRSYVAVRDDLYPEDISDRPPAQR
jgi:hypothetical protein